MSIPFIGLLAGDWAYLIQSTVIGFGPMMSRRKAPAGGPMRRRARDEPSRCSVQAAIAELFLEVFDHVVPLGFPVDEHIEAELLLLAHATVDLVTHREEISCLVDLPGLENRLRPAECPPSEGMTR